MRMLFSSAMPLNAPGWMSVNFGFSDRLMEERYRQNFVESCIDRGSPILRLFWLPTLAILRIFWLVYWLLYPFVITPMEYSMVVLKLLMMLFVGGVIGNKWNSCTKGRLGIFLLWISRLLIVMNFIRHVNVAMKNDARAMVGLVNFTCFCGMAIPNFSEYLCAALVLTYTKPILLYFYGDDVNHVQQILFQYTLILGLGASITWTIHTDCRRKWLRNPAATQAYKSALASGPAHDARVPPALRQSGLLASAAASTETDAVATDSSMDQLDDHYFTSFTDADSAEMLVEAKRVSRKPRRRETDTHTPGKCTGVF